MKHRCSCLAALLVALAVVGAAQAVDIRLQPRHLAMDVPYAASPRAFTVAVSFRAEFVPQNIAIPGFVATCGDALSNGFAIRLQPQGEKYVLQLCMGDSRRKGRSVWITDTQPEIEPGAWCRAIVRWDGRRQIGRTHV